MPILKRPALLASAALMLFANPALADHGAAGTGPQSAGPIVGTSARTLARGKAAFAIELALAEPDHRSDAVLAALAARHIHAHDQDHAEHHMLSAAYGITGDLTLSASLPYVRRIAIREGEHSHSGGIAINDVARRGNSIGLGDASLIAKWRFTGENHHGWEAAALAGVEVPTGATHRIDNEGERFETEHQPGTGSWSPLIGLALSRPLPRGILNASAIYQVATPGSQATRLGNRARFAIGLSHRLIGDRLAYHRHDDGDDHSDPAARSNRATLDGVFEIDGEWEGRQRVSGAIDMDSGGKALFVSPGLRLGIGRWSAVLGASLPLAQRIRQSHSRTRYRLRLGIGVAL